MDFEIQNLILYLSSNERATKSIALIPKPLHIIPAEPCKHKTNPASSKSQELIVVSGYKKRKKSIRYPHTKKVNHVLSGGIFNLFRALHIPKHTSANKDCVVPIFSPKLFCIPIQNTSNGSVPISDKMKLVAPKENNTQLIM